MREHTDGDFPFANDFNALVRDALEGGTQVESGCGVSDGGTQDMSVSVGSGAVVIDGTEHSISSQSVSLASADPDHPRYDLVVADSSGASAVTGTASSTPKAPSIPSGSVLLAIVEVPADVSGVTDAEINDARVLLDGIANTAVAALANFATGDTFSQYPLQHGTDVDAGASAHHTRYSDSEARTACDGQIDADTLDGKHASDFSLVTWSKEKRIRLDSGSASKTITFDTATYNWYPIRFYKYTSTDSYGSVSHTVHYEDGTTGGIPGMDAFPHQVGGNGKKLSSIDLSADTGVGSKANITIKVVCVRKNV